MAHKVVPAKYYVMNFAVITVLMILTVLFGKVEALNFSSNPNGINLAIALTIAIMKASCIVAIFMGVAFNTSLVRVFAIAGFAWLFILFGFTLTDYVNPSAEWGTPYYDSENPGASPLPDGQDHETTGSEALLVKSGVEYVRHGAHGADTGEGHDVVESGDHDTSGEDRGESPDAPAEH